MTFLENFGNLETVYKGNPTKTKWVYMTFSENFKNFWYIWRHMNAVFLRPCQESFFSARYILYIKSGIFKLQYLCAYLELDNVLGHYEIVLLEICWFPGSFLFFHNGRVPLSGAGLGGKFQIHNFQVVNFLVENYDFRCLTFSSMFNTR